MRLKSWHVNVRVPRVEQGSAVFLVLLLRVGAPMAAFPEDSRVNDTTRTPIKHVIVIIGENRIIGSS